MITPTDRSSKIGAVIRVSSGNSLEMYDFRVFGYYAAAIGRAFFPSGNPFVSLMLSLMTFGAGFLMRPLARRAALHWRKSSGETQRVTVSLDRRAFSFYDVEKNNWKAEPGKFSIMVGSSSEKIELQGEFTLSQ